MDIYKSGFITLESMRESYSEYEQNIDMLYTILNNNLPEENKLKIIKIIDQSLPYVFTNYENDYDNTDIRDNDFIPDKKTQKVNFKKAYKTFCKGLDNDNKNLDLSNCGCSVDAISKCFTFDEFMELNHRNKFKCFLHMYYSEGTVKDSNCKKCYAKNEQYILRMINELLQKPTKVKKNKSQ